MRRMSILLLLASSALGVAQSLPTIRTFVAGDEARYQLKLELGLFGETATYTADVAEKITAFDKDGYTVQLTQSNYRVMLFGDEGSVNDKDLPVALQSFGLNGGLKALGGDITSAPAYRMAAMRAVVLPGADVKEKGTWSAVSPADAERGIPARQAEYVWEATEKVKEMDCAKVKVTYKETEGAEPTSATGYAWIELKTGQVFQLELEFQNAVVPGGPGALTGKLSYLRV